MRSFETQLILTVDDLAGETDKGGQTDVILLDFSKAFDKVPHKRLLLKRISMASEARQRDGLSAYSPMKPNR